MNKRAWAEIDLDAIANNIREIRRIISPETKIMGVVKADGYGHGFVETTKVLLNNGVDYLAVATLEEAAQLRKRKFDVPILILGATETESTDDLVEYNVMPTVFNYSFAKALSDSAQKLGRTAGIHIKLDTGMSRIGFLCKDESIDEIIRISKLPNIKIDGIFSHFACSDEKNREYTRMQFDRFCGMCEKLEKNGIKIPIKHICNSAGIMMYPDMHLDMVRPGIIIYGLYPSDEVDKSKLNLKPAMTLKAKVTLVKEVEAGVGVSYGKTYITDKQTKIATVPIGYADGYLRTLSNKAHMLYDGKCVNVIGRICMDQCMIDVSNVNNINIGDEVTIFGTDIVTADTVAEWMGEINYEIVCMIGRRIPRVYIKDGKVVRKVAYLV